jgi:hypothetical protein
MARYRDTHAWTTLPRPDHEHWKSAGLQAGAAVTDIVPVLVDSFGGSRLRMTGLCQAFEP